jgi:hypothetical protein
MHQPRPKGLERPTPPPGPPSAKCEGCVKGYNGRGGNGYQPCGCKTRKRRVTVAEMCGSLRAAGLISHNGLDVPEPPPPYGIVLAMVLVAAVVVLW